MDGERAKLVCGNWAGHLQPMLSEGLDKRPWKEMVAEIVKHKFNCLRLTYAIYMWARYKDRKVGKTLEELIGLSGGGGRDSEEQSAGAENEELGKQKVKVLLYNHVSEPKWCCHDDHENGFFNDRHFDPKEWVKVLSLTILRLNMAMN